MIKMANNKLTYFITIVIILLILNSCKSINYMKYASNSYNSGRYSLSYFFVKKQLKRDSNDINAIELKSFIEEERHKYFAAKETYKKILFLGYESPAIFNSYGDLLYKTGNLYAAKYYFDKGYTIDSTLIFLNYNLTVIYFEELDSLETALSYINRELINNENNILSLLLKYDILFEMKDYNKITENANYILSLNLDNSEVFTAIGRAYFIQEKYDEALKFYTLAISSLNRESAPYYLRRESTYALLDEYHLALEDLNRAIRIDRDSLDGYVVRYYLYMTMNKLKLACKDLKKIIKLDKTKHYIQYYDNCKCK